MNGFQNPQGQQPPQQSPQQSLQQPPQQQQPQQQAQPRMLFKPEHMRALPDKFSIEEKKKWENGLAMLYRQIEANPPDTQAHRDAAKKIRDFSVTLHNKMQATANRPQVNPNQQRPPSQAPSQQLQADGSAPPSQPQPTAQTAPARPPVSENMRNHVNSFPYVAPSTLGPAEAAQWIQEIKGKYLKALLTMENTASGVKRLEAQVAVRTQGGKPLTPEEQKELQIKKEAFQKNHGDAKRFVDQFRRQQSDAAAQAAGGSQAQQPSHPPQGIAVPPRPTMNIQQPAQSQAMAQTEAVQAAMQAGRNQQVNGGRPSAPPPNQQNELQQQQQQQNQSQPIGAANAASMPPAQNVQGGGAAIKTESATAPPGGLPHVNTALATAPHIQQMQNRQQPAQNSPQSAVPPQATSVGPPKPLTHSDAVAHAARTYSSSQATTGQASVMASHSHPPSLPRDAPNIKTNLMPIPKILPPRATESPHPMQMPPTRPTYSGGPSGSGSGLMQQPVMQKAPGFNVEGDAERVLNKRKLDELIRQVTGGGEGLDNSEGLTPEVEDCVLSVADEFVDQVITAACKCAKARGSKTLEIRDIQLILERNYNIRIPGYASDEIRTVRKFLPAQGWIAKMSAVQASKVTGGKADL